MVSKSCLKEINRLRELYRIFHCTNCHQCVELPQSVSLVVVLCLISLKLKTISFPSLESPLIVQNQQSQIANRMSPSHHQKNNPQSVQHQRINHHHHQKDPDSPIIHLQILSIIIGTTHEQLCADVDLPLPPDEWKLAAIQILGPYSGVNVHNNLSSPARVRHVSCGEIALHIRDSVQGDGKCLFRAISKEITGTEENHIAVRLACYLPVSSQIRSLAFQLMVKVGNGSVMHQDLLETGRHVHMWKSRVEIKHYSVM